MYIYTYTIHTCIRRRIHTSDGSPQAKTAHPTLHACMYGVAADGKMIGLL